MTLQTSGPISLSQVQAEFGGSNPISMSEYYRGGSYVPDGSVTYGSYSSYQGNVSTYYWSDVDNSGTVTLRWNGSTIGSFVSSATTYTTGGYQYQKGTLFSSDGGGGGKGEPVTYYYRIRRRTVSGGGSANASIPTSGSISMGDFYGGAD